MSKLGASVKALINAAHARPGPVAAPRQIQSVYKKIEQEAKAHKLGRPSWLALSTATTMTMNSPESMIALYRSASENQPEKEAVAIAELMREVGLKCIGFNGVRSHTQSQLPALSGYTPVCLPGRSSGGRKSPGHKKRLTANGRFPAR